MYITIIITPLGKDGGVVIVDSPQHNHRIIALLDNKKSYKQILQQTMTKNKDFFIVM